jgi:hypothetical protein
MWHRGIWLIFLVSAASLKPFKPDDPLTCIVSQDPCQWERACEGGAYRSQLLMIPIPIQHHNIDRVSCCFKCMIHHFEPKSPLVINTTLLSEFSRSTKRLDHPEGKEVALMSKSHILRASHHIITNSLEVGSPIQYTMTSIGSSDITSWKKIQGRSLVLVNTDPLCVSSKTTQATLQRIEHAYNPLVKVYFTYQLPCQMSRKHEGWHDKIQLMPVGIRSPIAMAQFKKKHASRTKKIILDCSCAKSSTRWDQLMKGGILSMCSFGPDSASSIDISESNEEVEKLVEAYQFMNSARYVLSPSHPAAMSPCEWEALALGAIPIVQRNLLEHEKLSELFEDLPIYFADISSLSKEKLEGDYESMVREFTDPKYSLSKIYFPFWLGRLARYFITAKPPQRVWEDIGSLISQRKSQINECSSLDKRDPSSFTKFGHIGASASASSRALSKKTSVGRKTDLKLEFVLPRCCEAGDVEFGWVRQLLSVTSERTGMAIYYKCPSCLPLSKSAEWLRSKETRFLNSDFKGSRGITLLDDSPLLSVAGDRLYQTTCIDRIHNGKEVTAYLTHIVDHYDHLAEQTVFVHSVPHSHLHFELFYRLVAWAERCGNDTLPVDFIHLNVHFKTFPHLWTSCCGCKPWGPGSCRVGTWKFLFYDHPEMGPDYQHAHTYSSAQFAVSRRTLHHWPKSFYERMLFAINGTDEITGCCHSSSDESWGGHSLTGQYERMWHIIFGHSKFQQERKYDTSIPNYLRLDCGGDSRCSLGAL